GKCTIDRVERMFAFAVNADNGIELWEMNGEKSGGFYDQFTAVEGNNRSITRTSIESWMNTRSHDYNNPFQPKLLNMGELFIDDIVDSVTLVIKFKPDQYPTWITWTTLNICATVSQCTVQ